MACPGLLKHSPVILGLLWVNHGHREACDHWPRWPRRLPHSGSRVLCSGACFCLLENMESLGTPTCWVLYRVGGLERRLPLRTQVSIYLGTLSRKASSSQMPQDSALSLTSPRYVGGMKPQYTGTKQLQYRAWGETGLRRRRPWSGWQRRRGATDPDPWPVRNSLK